MRSLFLRAVRLRLVVLILLFLSTTLPRTAVATPDETTVMDAMHRATAYMMDTVSHQGGFLCMYTEDLERQWGEIPARRTMAWVQDPGTVSVGTLLLDAYTQTGDTAFLDASKRCANALILGQLPCGGWNYFIDFEPEKTEEWYAEIGAKAWGWEEFNHYYGNATFDDNATTGAADFLLELYRVTLDPAYKTPLLKALDFMLEAQYPLGGWRQRYPAHGNAQDAEHTHYWQYYTYNDGVIIGNIHFLLKAYKHLGDERYRQAALRGMHFVRISQMGTPQAGWSQQFDLHLNPGAARSYEPAGLCPSTTAGNIRHLLEFYKITGDRRFLRGIPEALDWLASATLPPGHSDQGHTHAQFIEVGTGKPLYAHREGTGIDSGRYWVDYEPSNFPGHYGMQLRLDVAPYRTEYERVFALTPAEAMAEQQAKEAAVPPTQNVSADAVQHLLDTVNEHGIWIEDLSAADHTDWKNKPRYEFRGISTRTYTKNMNTLLAYLHGLQAGN